MEPYSSDDSLNELRPSNTVGKKISLKKAKAWTTTYQRRHAGELQSMFFSADIFETLLRQKGATGIRIYNAIDSEGKECFVLVGATDKSDLTGLVPSRSITNTSNKVAGANEPEISSPSVTEEYAIFDKGQGCPDLCVVSPLTDFTEQ